MPFLSSIRLDDAPESGFPFELPTIRALRDGLALHPKVTFLVGENGSGKSTLVNAHCQFIIATHAPIILGYPDAWIYQLSEDGIARVDYDATEHVSLTRRFLNHREQMLARLLAPEE